MGVCWSGGALALVLVLLPVLMLALLLVLALIVIVTGQGQRPGHCPVLGSEYIVHIMVGSMGPR